MTQLRDRTKNTKLEGQLKKKSGTIVAESDHTVTMETKRGGQVLSKRDIAKTKSASHSPKTDTKKGNSHSLERKIAALKDAEERSEMELNKPLNFFAAKDYKNISVKKIDPHENKQNQRNPFQNYPTKPQIFSTVLLTKTTKLYNKKQKRRTVQKKTKTTNKTNMTQIATHHVTAKDQNDARTGMVKTSWYQKSKSQRDRCRKQMNRS